MAPLPPQSRFHPGYVAWDQDGRIFTERGNGVQGFGCVILRKSVLEKHVIHHGGRGDYDPTFYAELRGTRWRAKVDWGCEVGHGYSHFRNNLLNNCSAEPDVTHLDPSELTLFSGLNLLFR